MKTTKINWKAIGDRAAVVQTADYLVRFVEELSFNSPQMPFRGLPGYQLVYLPTGHVQAEGVDIVAAVAQIYREQRVLDKVKAKPELLTADPHEAQMADFLSDVDVGDRAKN